MREGGTVTPLRGRKIVVYAHGAATLVEQADDGTWLCPVCQQRHKSLLGQSQTRPNWRPEDRLLLGHDIDDKEREQERRDEDMGRPDFESPWAA